MIPGPGPPELVGCDAYTGELTPTSALGGGYDNWALARPEAGEQRQLIPLPIDPAAWRDERIGWGLILPDRPGDDRSKLATAADAPEPIQELVAQRGGKVLRFGAVSGLERWTLRDYAGGGDRLTAASPPGMGPDQLPMYLLIYGPPEVIPWEVQYALNPVRYVGRLDLTESALTHYVSALLDEWSGGETRYAAPVVWSVDHGGGDITSLMRAAIGIPLHAALSGDDDIDSVRFVDGASASATIDALTAALVENRPSLIVTTSHGLTGPLGDPVAMEAQLGAPVDQAHAVLDPENLLEAWQPDGAVWFAQACCSAGANQPSSYAGLFEPDSMLDRLLSAIAEVGPMISPLPRALLGAARPLRAFIGRVEPTFDWTMSFPPNRQQLTFDLQLALYDRMCAGQPVGLAMQACYDPIGALLIAREQEIDAYNRSAGAAEERALNMVLYSKVAAYDRAATVILGDPTVAIPLPKPAR